MSFLFVGSRDFLGRFRIEPPQDTMQMAGRMLFDARAEPFAQFLPSARGTSARPSRSARKYNPVPTVNTGNRLRCRRSPRMRKRAGGSLLLLRRPSAQERQSDDEEMPRALGEAGFCGANIKAAIKLCRIADYHLRRRSVCKLSRRAADLSLTPVGPMMATSGKSRFIFGSIETGDAGAANKENK